MEKFLSREEWLDTINSWIRDGSELESFGTTTEAEWVILRGKDGAREELYFFFTEDAFDALVI